MSLRSKAILIFTIISLVYTGLLTVFMFYLSTTALELWEKEEIEDGLVIAVDKAESGREQAMAKKALMTYRQLKGLKSLYEWQIVGFSIIVGAAFFIITVLVISLVLFRITKPMRQLAVALGKTGDEYVDVRIRKPDKEIAQVVDAYNKMIVQLKKSRERLRQAERIAAWRDAARTMAHEVRNPLMGIRLSVERLQKRYREKATDLPEVVEKSTQMVLNEINALEKLAKEFSDFARLPEPVLKPTDLNELITKLSVDFSEHSKGIQIDSRLDKAIPKIMIDKELFRRVFLNLFRNTLDVQSQGKARITITTGLKDATVVITFADDGPGIEKEDIAKIFDPYYTTKASGTGLGLAVVKKIITEHNGEVKVKSEKDRGTEFIIILPLPQNLTKQGE